MKRGTWLFAGVFVLLACTTHAYLTIGVEANGRVQDLKWNMMPVRYYVSNRDVPGVSATQLATVAHDFLWIVVQGSRCLDLGRVGGHDERRSVRRR
jgi:hypothetical protein